MTDLIMPLLAAYKTWRGYYAATAGTLEYPDMPRADADTLKEELLETFGINKLIEIQKRTTEKE